MSVSRLLSGKAKSCGCHLTKRGSRPNHRHGHHGTYLYRAWCGIIQRCTNSNNKSYKKDIKISPLWKESFKKFLDDVGEQPTPSHRLVRRDRYDNYEFWNLKWILK